MKRIAQTGLLLLCTFSFFNIRGGLADSSQGRIEVPIDTVFAPQVGFDDNDNVQIVLDGYLPNACYTLADQKIERRPQEGIIRVRQFATKLRGGLCGKDDSLPDYLDQPVPYTVEVSLGSLSVADYRVEYRREDQSFGVRTFSVQTALSPTIDSLSYAAVTHALISDVFSVRDNPYVILSGVLTSTCAELSEEVEVNKQGDVFVILPVLKVKDADRCAYVLRPFQKRVHLGQLPAGRYLAHVRSMNGKSVNRAFTVIGSEF